MSEQPPPPPPPPPSPPPPPDGAAATPAAPSRAQLHSTESSRTYPCDACGGELHFDIAAQKLKCAHCGNTHDLVESVGTVEERDLAGAIDLVRQGAGAHRQQFLDGEKEIVCQNCGGHSTFTGSLTAKNCPYCATPIQRDDVHAAPERLAVDGVLPFTVDEKQAKELIETWINKRWFAPSEFKTYNRTGSFSSVYTAYFTYDATTYTMYRGRRGDDYTVTVGHGDDRRTETRTDWTPVRGSVNNSFDDITILANTGFETKRVEKLEPWPTEQSKPYSPEFIAGHLCRTYDRDVEDCLTDATAIMENEIRSTIRRDIGGDHQDITAMDIAWKTMSYKHLLLPMWLLTVIYMDRPFQVYINGVTGEVHGARPYSKVKIIAAIAVVVLLIALIVVAVSAGGNSS